MKNLRNLIDIEEIAESIGMGSVDQQYFLDTETGKIIWLPDRYSVVGDLKEFEDDRARIDSDTTERYLCLPFVKPYEGYQDMEDFIEGLSDERLKELLFVAINGQGAFRRFKDMLLGFPDSREKWFKFKNQRNLERAREWLEDIEDG